MVDDMKIIEVCCDNTGIHAYPICVAWYDTVTLRGAYYVIRPTDYWGDTEHSRTIPPTRTDALQYGIDVAEVSYLLNKNLSHEIVYTTNAVDTIDKLSLVYESCGDKPAFDVENLIEIISISDIGRYEREIINLNKREISFPLFYCVEVALILGEFSIDY